MSNKKLELKLVKSTKGTHVYGSDEEDAAIPSVYIKKHALPKDPPQVITITLSWEKE